MVTYGLFEANGVGIKVRVMEKQTVCSAILFAFVAAVGNALFVLGQRKSTIVAHPFIFNISALLVCLFLFSVTSLFLPKPEISSFVKDNYPWVLTSGLGFYLTFIGFYLLFNRYGASHYVIYAVLSIITTSIIVGTLLLREPFNLYHLMSVIMAIVTVALFTIGQSKGG